MTSKNWLILGALALAIAAPLSGCGDNDNDETIFIDCGNGALDGNEQCDDGNSIETDDCLSTCRFARCGDGFIQTGEEACDSSNLSGASCSSLGLGNGTLRCSSACELDTSGCGGGAVPTTTPTPVVEPTPTTGGGEPTPTNEPTDGNPTPTPTSTPGAGPACNGNVVLDLELTANGSPIAIGGFQLQLSYPAAVRIPGTGSEAGDAVDLPPGLPSVNDQDTDSDLVDDRVDIAWVSSGAAVTGTIATVTFECAPGASEPSTGDFDCNVTSASDELGTDIQGVSCGVTIQ